MALTFDALRDANASRVARWHDPESSSWTIADWSNAMCGEAGELANVIKKIRRQEDGARGVDSGTRDSGDHIKWIPIVSDHILGESGSNGNAHAGSATE